MFEPGTILKEQYQLQQRLGRSAPGRQTWLATDFANPATPANVIIKLLVFADMQWQDLRLFEREAQVLKTLEHPKIPCYRNHFQIEPHSQSALSWWGLVQDYIPGESLQTLLDQQQRWSELEVCQIAQEVLQILEYLHGLCPPVLHRDIKPSNLILDPDKQVWLVDFGAVQDQAAVTGVSFTVVGTVGYAPLEQFWGRTVAASDLYALGATLIHLLTGIAPADLPQQDLRIQFSDRTTADPSFVNWLKKLTEPAVEHRFATVKEARQALAHRKDIAHNPASRNETLCNSSVPSHRPPSPQIVIKQKTAKTLEIDIYKSQSRSELAGAISSFVYYFLVIYLPFFWPFTGWWASILGLAFIFAIVITYYKSYKKLFLEGSIRLDKLGNRFIRPVVK